jgi:hypothetical protein
MIPDPLVAAERYRKEAGEFSELAKTAETAFVRDYYERIAQRTRKIRRSLRECRKASRPAKIEMIKLQMVPAFKPPLERSCPRNIGIRPIRFAGTFAARSEPARCLSAHSAPPPRPRTAPTKRARMREGHSSAPSADGPGRRFAGPI